MNINNPITVDKIKEANGNELRYKLFTLANWDMDTFNNYTENHGLTLANIVDVRCVIINDAGTLIKPIESCPLAGGNAGGWVSVETTWYEVRRIAGGIFDNANYNDNTITRGYVMITYI